MKRIIVISKKMRSIFGKLMPDQVVSVYTRNILIREVGQKIVSCRRKLDILVPKDYDDRVFEQKFISYWNDDIKRGEVLVGRLEKIKGDLKNNSIKIKRLPEGSLVREIGRIVIEFETVVVSNLNCKKGLSNFLRKFRD